jgi:hypothetical protein
MGVTIEREFDADEPDPWRRTPFSIHGHSCRYLPSPYGCAMVAGRPPAPLEQRRDREAVHVAWVVGEERPIVLTGLLGGGPSSSLRAAAACRRRWRWRGAPEAGRPPCRRTGAPTRGSSPAMRRRRSGRRRSSSSSFARPVRRWREPVGCSRVGHDWGRRRAACVGYSNGSGVAGVAGAESCEADLCLRRRAAAREREGKRAWRDLGSEEAGGLGTLRAITSVSGCAEPDEDGSTPSCRIASHGRRTSTSSIRGTKSCTIQSASLSHGTQFSTYIQGFSSWPEIRYVGLRRSTMWEIGFYILGSLLLISILRLEVTSCDFVQSTTRSCWCWWK